jgi:soluble lytic murein transglycosylase-like protein
MTDAGASTRAPSRGRARTRAVIVLVVFLTIIGCAAVAAWLAISGAKDKGYLGGPVVVPAEYRPILKKAAKRCDAVPLEVLAAQISAESGWDPKARSGAGAQGIAQFMPEVWKQYGVDGNGDGVADVWDPVDAIHSAAELNCLNRRLVRSAKGNRLHNTLAAYNSGYGSVLKYDGVPPFPETEAYVAKILDISKTIVVRP